MTTGRTKVTIDATTTTVNFAQPDDKLAGEITFHVDGASTLTAIPEANADPDNADWVVIRAEQLDQATSTHLVSISADGVYRIQASGLHCRLRRTAGSADIYHASTVG